MSLMIVNITRNPDNLNLVVDIKYSKVGLFIARLLEIFKVVYCTVYVDDDYFREANQ